MLTVEAVFQDIVLELILGTHDCTNTTGKGRYDTQMAAKEDLSPGPFPKAQVFTRGMVLPWPMSHFLPASFLFPGSTLVGTHTGEFGP